MVVMQKRRIGTAIVLMIADGNSPYFGHTAAFGQWDPLGLSGISSSDVMYYDSDTGAYLYRIQGPNGHETYGSGNIPPEGNSVGSV